MTVLRTRNVGTSDITRINHRLSSHCRVQFNSTKPARCGERSGCTVSVGDHRCARKWFTSNDWISNWMAACRDARWEEGWVRHSRSSITSQGEYSARKGHRFSDEADCLEHHEKIRCKWWRSAELARGQRGAEARSQPTYAPVPTPAMEPFHVNSVRCDCTNTAAPHFSHCMDLPLLGTAEGGGGDSTLTNEPILPTDNSWPRPLDANSDPSLSTWIPHPTANYITQNSWSPLATAAVASMASVANLSSITCRPPLLADLNNCLKSRIGLWWNYSWARVQLFIAWAPAGDPPTWPAGLWICESCAWTFVTVRRGRYLVVLVYFFGFSNFVLRSHRIFLTNAVPIYH